MLTCTRITVDKKAGFCAENFAETVFPDEIMQWRCQISDNSPVLRSGRRHFEKLP
jgi:hypothetical protein